jgi:hypothetical protein
MPAPQPAPKLAARPRAASAEAILEELLGCAVWEAFRGPTGARLWRIPGSDGSVYTVARGSCTCPWDRYSQGAACKHRQALGLYLVVAADATRRALAARPASAPRETPDSVV